MMGAFSPTTLALDIHVFETIVDENARPMNHALLSHLGYFPSPPYRHRLRASRSSTASGCGGGYPQAHFYFSCPHNHLQHADAESLNTERRENAHQRGRFESFTAQTDFAAVLSYLGSSLRDFTPPLTAPASHRIKYRNVAILGDDRGRGYPQRTFQQSKSLGPSSSPRTPPPSTRSGRRINCSVLHLINVATLLEAEFAITPCTFTAMIPSRSVSPSNTRLQPTSYWSCAWNLCSQLLAVVHDSSVVIQTRIEFLTVPTGNNRGRWKVPQCQSSAPKPLQAAGKRGQALKRWVASRGPGCSAQGWTGLGRTWGYGAACRGLQVFGTFGDELELVLASFCIAIKVAGKHSEQERLPVSKETLTTRRICLIMTDSCCKAAMNFVVFPLRGGRGGRDGQGRARVGGGRWSCI
ncbi:hypothetical protein B0H16DRAFT_1695900 [Mycena metata]|uniref:Uncharacterized protein n=1 Tax=Mycena metata TaxID=1033252 RepID=A0AAD7I4Y3_9AGAR|nr:hypothetical protein B0H16DRAFT_1695900 [Mycena metata]